MNDSFCRSNTVLSRRCKIKWPVTTTWLLSQALWRHRLHRHQRRPRRPRRPWPRPRRRWATRSRQHLRCPTSRSCSRPRRRERAIERERQRERRWAARTRQRLSICSTTFVVERSTRKVEFHHAKWNHQKETGLHKYSGDWQTFASPCSMASTNRKKAVCSCAAVQHASARQEKRRALAVMLMASGGTRTPKLPRRHERSRLKALAANGAHWRSLALGAQGAQNHTKSHQKLTQKGNKSTQPW